MIIKILRSVRIILVFIYAIILLILIPLFFMNYNGEWLKKVADALPVKEISFDN